MKWSHVPFQTLLCQSLSGYGSDKSRLRKAERRMHEACACESGKRDMGQPGPLKSISGSCERQHPMASLWVLLDCENQQHDSSHHLCRLLVTIKAFKRTRVNWAGSMLTHDHVLGHGMPRAPAGRYALYAVCTRSIDYA